jgi:clan AA aspartic protease
MGKVMAKVKLTNSTDRAKHTEGSIAETAVRTVEVEAMADTGATLLVITGAVASSLGVNEIRRTKVRYADGRVAPVSIVGPIHVEICGRSMSVDAVVEPHATQVLIGQIPLEGLDLVVDPKSREVSVNPASPDMSLLDMLSASKASIELRTDRAS